MFMGFFQLLGAFALFGSALVVQICGGTWSNFEAHLLKEDDFSVLPARPKDEHSFSVTAWSSFSGTIGEKNIQEFSWLSNIQLDGTHEVPEASNASAFRPQEYVIGITRYMDKGHFPRSPDFANLYRCILLA